MKNLSKLSVALFSAMAVSSGAYAGIVGSRHDLSSGGQGQDAGGTAEVCVFCHTPHGADTDAPAPLWNKNLADPASYVGNRYSDLGTSSLDGDEAPIGSVSLSCLSCHDGTQAMDVVINAPGTGGYNSQGASINNGAFMTGFANLSTDLRNDHPISIQYAGGACQGTTADCDPATSSITGSDPDFEVAQYLGANGGYWWVDTGVSGFGTREKSDMILYTRTDFANQGVTSGPSVECASCHDPHNNDSFSATAGQESVAFLRISNAGSNVCVACHTK